MRSPSVLSLRAALLTVAAGAVFTLPAGAQSRASGSTLRIGVMAGANSATLGGKDVDDADRRTGFVGGVYIVKPFAGPLAFRPELLFSQKGAKTSLSVDQVDVDATLKLSYLDIPVLLQVESPAASGVRPHVYAGPSFGFKADCKIEASAGGVSQSIDCDQDFDLKSFDLGAVIGGGVGFALGTVEATVGARYQHGFSDIAKDATAKNRVFSIYASVELGKR